MNAIEKARGEYQTPNAWWPIPLIDAIQRIDVALCIPWVASCLLEFLSTQQHEYAAVLSERVRRAVEMTSAQEIQGLLAEYDSVFHPHRDNILLSYRHLLQGKQFLLSRNLTGVRTQITWALILLGDCDFYRRTNIQFILDQFSRFVPSLPECTQ